MTQIQHTPARTRPAVRVASWLAALLGASLAVLALGVHHARAYVDELARSAGADMLRYARANQQDARRTLVVNGLRIHVGSGGTADAPRAVLDAFHERCRTRGVAFDAPLRDPAHAAFVPDAVARTLPLDGVLRLDDAEHGYVACLDAGGRRLTPDDLLDRTRRFLADGDLAHLGELRFAAVERRGPRTHYLALWSEGSFPLGRAFPPQGDAPGKDPTGIPRVAGARRVLSAWQSDQVPSITLYRADATSVPALASRYRHALERAGFQLRADAPDDRGLVAVRDDAWFLVAFAADGPDAIASITPL